MQIILDLEPIEILVASVDGGRELLDPDRLALAARNGIAEYVAARLRAFGLGDTVPSLLVRVYQPPTDPVRSIEYNPF